MRKPNSNGVWVLGENSDIEVENDKCSLHSFPFTL